MSTSREKNQFNSCWMLSTIQAGKTLPHEITNVPKPWGREIIFRTENVRMEETTVYISQILVLLFYFLSLI